jgi:hypothetical protein
VIPRLEREPGHLADLTDDLVVLVALSVRHGSVRKIRKASEQPVELLGYPDEVGLEPLELSRQRLHPIDQ